ncbi:MAG: hypothetical protein AUI99_05265 [Gemmatimonadetes bacterium 13_1_40CM_3_69_22]|nr:MAG: hypothetical protein AUI99_05265 [Gemmatimonadetes bacterium 13_1_40CM_3_69_22]
MGDRQCGAAGRLSSQEVTEAGDHGEGERGVAPAHAGDRLGDAGNLRVAQRVGDRADRCVIEHFAIGAHDPGEPLPRQRSRGGAPVRRGDRVLRRRELTPPEVNIARERERFRRHAAGPSPERNAGCDSLRRRAQGSRVDQLALAQPLGIGATDRRGRALHDRNDVGGGGAHVDQDAIGEAAGHEARRRGPVGGRHGERVAARLVRGAPAPVDRVHAHQSVRKGLRHGLEDERHTLALGAKQLRQLGGHGHRVGVAGLRAELPRETVEQRRERGGIALNLVRHHPRGGDAGARRTGHFRVDATDVPAEHALHTPRVRGTLACG